MPTDWDSARLILTFVLSLFFLPEPFLPKFWLNNYIIHLKYFEMCQTEEGVT